MTFYSDDHVTLHHGDAAAVLATLPAGSVDCIVTSPPYFGLRDYGVDGQLGAEPTPAQFVEAITAVFREARRVLADDGTLWLNLGDSMWRGGATGFRSDERSCGNCGTAPEGCQGGDSSSSCRCGAHRASAATPRRSAHSDTQHAAGSEPCGDDPSLDRTASHCPCPGSSDSVHRSPSAQSDPSTPGQQRTPLPGGEPLPASPESTTPEFGQQLPAECSHSGSCACGQRELRSSAGGAPGCARKEACTCDTSALSDSSAAGRMGRGSSGSAWGDSTSAFLPAKNLLMMPARVALALQADGWILRNDIVWAKPNAMPESVTDRLSNRHEHVFMFSKRPRYWFDLDAVREQGQDRGPAMTWGERKAVGAPMRYGTDQLGSYGGAGVGVNPAGRNPGDVWSIPTTPFSAAHFATMPPALAGRCILAGCKPGGVVLDPFSGSGTTGLAATENGRRYVGIDLNEEYLELSLRTRLRQGVLDLGA